MPKTFTDEQLTQFNTALATASNQLEIAMVGLTNAANSVKAATDRLTTTSPVVTPPVAQSVLAGFYVGDYSLATAGSLAKWLGWPQIPLVEVFPTRDTAASMTSNWWSSSVPKGARLCVKLPLWPTSATVTDDLTIMWTTLAQQIKAVDPEAFICLGWEMNLKSNAWALTQVNMIQWRAAWSRAYAAIKAVMPNCWIGYNPNGGPSEAGTLPSVEAGIVRGQVDFVGPDQYDMWPGGTNAANLATQLGRPYGLNWWARYAAQLQVPLAVPEWGVAHGTNGGNDNPTYIQQMSKFFSDQASNLLFQVYFREPAAYIKSDIGPLSANPLSSAAFKAAFGK